MSRSWDGFYERFADRAVEIGRRVVFQAAGEAPTLRCVGRLGVIATRSVPQNRKTRQSKAFVLSQLLRQSELAVSDAQAISAVLFQFFSFERA